jgi:flagellar secretion chaperone FliS
MKESQAAFAYQQSSARSATPVGQVVALYDTILRDFRRANEAHAAGNVEKRVFELNHALTVIGHLRSVLDHERGGEATKRLERFYEVTHAMVVQASVSGATIDVNKLIELYSSLREAWQVCERQVAMGGGVAIPEAPAVPKVVYHAQTPGEPVEEALATSRSNWRA